jgi:ATP-binding cassette subfamily B protein
MIRAWFSLFLATLLIKIYNLKQVTTLMRKRKLKCKEKMSPLEAQKLFWKIEKAKFLYLTRTACLEQSLALFLLATSKRKSVEWCIGVRLSPFASHAWIEVDGESVQESETIEVYQKVVTV